MGFDRQRFLAVPSIHDINPKQLKARGVKALCFDLDNTCDPLGFTSFSDETLECLGLLQIDGFLLCFATNALRNLNGLTDGLHHPDGYQPFVMQPSNRGFAFGIGKSPKKPQPEYFHEVLRRLGDPHPSTVAMIGDKFGADVLGAMRVGMHGVLVNPCGPDLPLERLTGMRRKEDVNLAKHGVTRPS